MVEIFTECVAGIEILHAVPAGKINQALPTVFFYHGFTSSKELYAYFPYALAKAGLRVIAPDAAWHGARYNGDANQRLAHFWQILHTNIIELPGLQQEYQQRGLLIDGCIGVCGASMGGMTTLGALTHYSWINAAACFMGSGYFGNLSRQLFPPLQADGVRTDDIYQQHMAPLLAYDVSQQLASIADRPLLLWHGEADDLVPATESARLQRELQQAGYDRQLTYVTEAGIGHKITPAALQTGVDFFTTHLLKSE